MNNTFHFILRCCTVLALASTTLVQLAHAQNGGHPGGQNTGNGTPATQYSVTLKRDEASGETYTSSGTTKTTKGDTIFSFSDSEVGENAVKFHPDFSSNWGDSSVSWKWTPKGNTSGNFINYDDTWQYHRQIIPINPGGLGIYPDGSLYGTPKGKKRTDIYYRATKNSVTRLAHYVLWIHEPVEVAPPTPVSSVTRKGQFPGAIGVENPNSQPLNDAKFDFSKTFTVTSGVTASGEFNPTELLKLGVELKLEFEFKTDVSQSIPAPSIPSGYKTTPAYKYKLVKSRYKVDRYDYHGFNSSKSYNQDVEKMVDPSGYWTKVVTISSSFTY